MMVPLFLLPALFLSPSLCLSSASLLPSLFLSPPSSVLALPLLPLRVLPLLHLLLDLEFAVLLGVALRLVLHLLVPPSLYLLSCLLSLLVASW